MRPESPDAPRHWPAATIADLDDLLAREHIDFVHVGLFDTGGVFREKRVPAALALQYASKGWSFIDACRSGVRTIRARGQSVPQ